MNKYVNYRGTGAEYEIYYKEFMNSPNFIDISSAVDYISPRCRNIITGPRHSGKSMLLSMLRCFYDINLDFSSVFQDADILQSGSYRIDRMNRHPVIYIDFSDFCAEDRSAAIRYFRRKMRYIYWEYVDYLLEPRIHGNHPVERYIRLMDESADENLVFDSLMLLSNALTVRDGRYSDRIRPVVLLDDFYNCEIYAEHFGYYDEIAPLLCRFYDHDPYENIELMVMTAFSPVGHKIHYSECGFPDYIYGIDCCRKVCEINGIHISQDDAGKRYGHEFYAASTLLPAECYTSISDKAEQTGRNPDCVIDYDMAEQLENTRLELHMLQFRENIRQEISVREEEEQYAKKLPACIMIPSPFAGIRSCEINTQTDAYRCRDRIIKELFRSYTGKPDRRLIYDSMQKYDKNKDSGWDNKQLEILKNEADSTGKWKKCEITTDDEYWGRFSVEVESGSDRYIGDLSMIKSYVSVKDLHDLNELFSGAVVSLIDKGRNRFHAKVSRHARIDNMCFWTSRYDFEILQSFFDKNQDKICTPIPFVAYHKNIGISRELATWDSHSGRQSDLILSYYETLRPGDTPELSDMYDLYVKAWNGMLSDDHPMSREFKRSNAQEFIILMETINAIVNEEGISDDNILMSDDDILWHALCDGKNWYSVGRKLITNW